MVENQVVAAHSAVTHNSDTDDKKHLRRDGMDAHMDLECWQQCLEFVVVTHSNHVLGDLPWLPVVCA